MSLEALSVSQLNNRIKTLIAGTADMNNVYVTGEASNVKYHTNGYIYFSLKENKSVISGVVFKWDVPYAMTFRMKDGDQVLVYGNVAYSDYNGSCQLQAKRIALAGVGDLNARFEELKAKLAEMGMFDPMYKKPIPQYVTSIGVVTSPTGAAVQDIIRVSRSRYPGVRIVVYPALVQGEGAAASIVKGIQILDGMGLDVLIVGRGGGSKEDLWCFNEEIVAKAIFDAQTPIISAVGHEVDNSISDLVADKRAATPSAAAEMAVFDKSQEDYWLNSTRNKLLREMTRHIDKKRAVLQKYEVGLRHLSPRSQLLSKVNRLTDLEDKMTSAMKLKIKVIQQQLDSYKNSIRYVSPRYIFNRRTQQLRALAGRLDAISPVKRLSSGFSYVTDEGGRNVKNASDVEIGSMLTVFMNKGSLKAEVKEKSDGLQRS